MSFSKRLALLAIVLLAARGSLAQPLVAHEEASQALSVRWAWALEQSANQQQAWIVYRFPTSIDERYMGQNHFSNHFNHNGRVRMLRASKRLSLNALRAGITDSKQSAPIHVELLLLARVSSGEIDSVELASPTDAIDWRKAPVYWLDEASLSASFRMLGELLDPERPSHFNRSLIKAIALHAHSDRSSYLYSLYNSQQWAELRPSILAGLAMQRSQSIENMLLEVLAGDDGEELRRIAISALAEYSSPVALDALLAAAEDDSPSGLREAAIKSLGEFNTDAVRSRLNEVAWYDGDEDLREEAVQSLSRLDDQQANALLLEVARNHPSRETRSEAMEALGDKLFQ